jgi:FMN phosphatase YigB (HAD superfamily)
MTTSVEPPRAGARVLLFDFGGTLDAEGVPWKDRFFRLAREEGLDVSQAEFDPAFYGATDSLEGTIPAEAGFRETVERVTDGLATRLGRERALLGRIGDRFTGESVRQLEKSAVLLSRLSDRYRIGIVSNFYGNLQAVCDEVGLAPSIGVAVDSTLAGCKKPDPKIFRAALDALQASPGEAVFVGDSLRRDMAGAREMGMRHVWLRSESASGNGGPCCPEDPVIGRLTELLRLEL